MSHWIAIAWLLPLTLACGPRVVAPRAAPDRVLPNIPPPDAPPAAEQAGLYFDVTEGAAQVSRVRGSKRTTMLMSTTQFHKIPGGGGYVTVGPPKEVAVEQLDLEPLCNTPCYVELPKGHNNLALLSHETGATEMVSLDLRPGVHAYRHALGHPPHKDVGKMIGAGSVLGLGIALLATGPLLLVVDETTVGTGFMVAGGVGTALGAWLLYRVWPEEQRGTGTFWTP